MWALGCRVPMGLVLVLALAWWASLFTIHCPHGKGSGYSPGYQNGLHMDCHKKKKKYDSISGIIVSHPMPSNKVECLLIMIINYYYIKAKLISRTPLSLFLWGFKWTTKWKTLKQQKIDEVPIIFSSFHNFCFLSGLLLLLLHFFK